MPDEWGIGVDWNLIKQESVDWARKYSFELVGGIAQTSVYRVQNAVGNYFTEGQTIGSLENYIGKIFGVDRAEAIAVTEVTRAAAEGERAVGKELSKQGIQMVEVWETNNDSLVCETCDSRHGKKEGDGWTKVDGPPAHPRCRCWINHELPKPKAGALEAQPEALGEIRPVSELSTDWATTDENIADWYERGEDVLDKDIKARAKDDIVHNLASRSGLDYDKTNKMIRTWAKTSNDDHVDALHMQERASKLFGIEPSDWQNSKIAANAHDVSYRVYTDDEIDRFLKAMYNNTQEQLSNAGIKSIRLSRGIALDEDDIQTIMDSIQEGDKIGLDSNVMESWTTDPRVSSRFGNVTIEAEVPANRIIGSARTGYGCLDEYEFVVIGSDSEEYATLAGILP